ncbi:hypothetical protein [Mycetohabitans endofungorum]|uniref:hypothetical protein n=1 Tax=Mycetohabitans endofungorum TaxID=417203 RepID=UPI0030CCB31D
MQLNLDFVPPDEDGLWQQLDQATRKAVIDGLAQAIAKAVANSNDQSSRETNDE